MIGFWHRRLHFLIRMIDWSSVRRAPWGVLKKKEDRPLAGRLAQKQHACQKRLSYQLTLSKCALGPILKSDCLLLVSAWKFIQITEELVCSLWRQFISTKKQASRTFTELDCWSVKCWEKCVLGQRPGLLQTLVFTVLFRESASDPFRRAIRA